MAREKKSKDEKVGGQNGFLPELDDGAQTEVCDWLGEWSGSIASEPTAIWSRGPQHIESLGLRRQGPFLRAARPIGEVLPVLGTTALWSIPVAVDMRGSD
jgi:hypothetical protein